MGSLYLDKFHVRKVAIIGAGPSGLAAAKYLRAHRSVESIVIFEQQDEVGGIWNYNKIAPGPYPAPQEDPFYPSDKPETSGIAGQPPIFPSAMYDRLHANIPSTLMRFSDQKFPDDAWIFPSREAIQTYLVEYSQDVRSLIKFCFEVKKVSLRHDEGRETWAVEAQSTTSDEMVSDVFDAVVIANGHYAVPFTPHMKSMERFNEAYPSIITHSKQYRTAEHFKDKKVIVVGNGPSGADIALQINNESRGPTLLSVRHPTPPDKLEHMGCDEVAEIDEFLVEQRAVKFQDGRTEADIDAIVFCTGFFYRYPFFPDMQHKLITTGKGVHGLYKHLFCIQHPTLVFPALNIKSVPWPLAEVQAAVFSAVWANDLDLPSAEEMDRWSRQLHEASGEALHIFATKEDGRYINELHDWAAKARHVGKEPPRWNDEMLWQRSIILEAKMIFEQRERKAKTMEELGFHYEPAETDANT